MKQSLPMVQRFSMVKSGHVAARDPGGRRLRGRGLRSVVTLGAVVLGLCVPAGAPGTGEVEPPPPASARAGAPTGGPLAGGDHFPIAVWLQDPRNAGRYREIGINLYVGLWRGPTAEQLEELQRHGMAVICSWNERARSRLGQELAKPIIGWMHGDEPDNAQRLADGKGYGPPVDPAKIVAAHEAIRAADPGRPVLLNLGQGVAWDGWHGRGVRTNHPEDYEHYVKGCDIVSFDIYPVVHDRPAVAGKLWYVPRGVERLRRWTGGKKPVWSCIECTRIDNPQVKPTPDQVKAEVWMAIIHGARGLIYFCHQFQPRFIEAGLLADEEMARAVGAINRQIRELAPALNSPALANAVAVETAPAAVSPELAAGLGPRAVATLATEHGGTLHVFAVRMEPAPARAVFRVKGLSGNAAITVVGEDRTLEATDGSFADDFGPHAVHIYRLTLRRG
jgi:hypothetical protein